MQEAMPDCNREEWRPVVGYEGIYEVSNFGRIKRARTGYLLNPTVTTRGYAIVNLVDASRGLRKCSHVYNIVSAAFLGPKPLGLCVNHIDGVKTNNVLWNLEYVTYRENSQHAIRTGLIQRDLSPDQVREVRALQGHLGAIRTGKLLGINHRCVSAIWLRKSYADID